MTRAPKTTLERARGFAVDALKARLTGCPPEKRPLYRDRIAFVKSGRLDTAPEVQSALLAIEAAEQSGGKSGS